MNSCPLCSGIDLNGDLGAPASGSPFDMVLRRGPEVVLTPTVGTIVPGYLMAVLTRHRLSFGECGAEVLRSAIRPWLSQQLEELETMFGRDYVVFEHGSASEEERHGGCVVHAHLHLVPGGHGLGEQLRGEARGWEEVPGLEDLADLAASGYAYLSFGERSWAIPSPGFPGQWVRRGVARWAGIPEEWDWQLFRGEHNLEETFAVLEERDRQLLDKSEVAGS